VAINYKASFKNIFPDGKLKTDLALQGKYNKDLRNLRNQAIRLFSDFISEELQKGGYGGKLTSQQKSIFKRATGAAGDISPDSILNIDNFFQLLTEEGIVPPKVLQSQILKGEALTGTTETKVSGIGDSDAITVTSFSLYGKDSDLFTQTTKRLGRKALTGDAAVEFLFNPKLKKYKDILLRSTQAKFENLTLVNYDDKKGFGVNFIPNPLGAIPLTKTNVKKYFNIYARYVPKDKRVRVSIETNRAFTEDLKKRSTDITKAILRAHQKVNKNQTFGQGFLNYYRQRLGSIKTNDALGLTNFTIAFAREFDRNPFMFKTDLKTPVSKYKQEGGVKVLDDRQRKEPKKLQEEITAAQLTALVYERLGRKMPRTGPYGPALSETILSERSGRFRRSVEVIPQIRQGIIAFTYDPLYKVFVGTSRDPDRFVGETIREVAQKRVARAFRLVRT
jgi:hypothetical protein